MTPDRLRKIAEAVNALIRRTDWAALENFADDTAAATGGVEIGELYRTGSAIKVRVT
jgi:hypothetical protein